MLESEVVPHLPSQGECRAVVDVGTNSVKLLIGRVRDTHVAPILERGIQTRLGDGFFTSRRLRPDAIARTAAAVADLAREARSHQPARFRVIATAAAREALNQSELLEALRPASGTDIEILSGQTEADLAFRGVCSGPGLSKRSLLVADVGGGSTELILGDLGQRRFGHSFPVGAVRLWEALRPPENPRPEDLERCRAHLDRLLRETVCPNLPAPIQGALPDHSRPDFVGVGGTAALLACIAQGLERYDRERIEATCLSSDAVADWTTRLWRMPLSDRRRLRGLPPERADIILTGSAIYEALLRVLGLPGMTPSTRGLRFAALLDQT